MRVLDAKLPADGTPCRRTWPDRRSRTRERIRLSRFHLATIDSPTRTVGRSPALTRFAGANELLGRAHFSLVVSMNPAYLQRSRSPVEQRSASRPCVRRSEPERSRSNSFERIIAKRFATTG